MSAPCGQEFNTKGASIPWCGDVELFRRDRLSGNPGWYVAETKAWEQGKRHHCQPLAEAWLKSGAMEIIEREKEVRTARKAVRDANAQYERANPFACHVCPATIDDENYKGRYRFYSTRFATHGEAVEHLRDYHPAEYKEYLIGQYLQTRPYSCQPCFDNGKTKQVHLECGRCDVRVCFATQDECDGHLSQYHEEYFAEMLRRRKEDEEWETWAWGWAEWTTDIIGNIATGGAYGVAKGVTKAVVNGDPTQLAGVALNVTTGGALGAAGATVAAQAGADAAAQQMVSDAASKCADGVGLNDFVELGYEHGREVQDRLT